MMAVMRTANPTLQEQTFGHFDPAEPIGASVMTLQGTVNKTGMLLAIAVLAACFTWWRVMPQGVPDPAVAQMWIIGGAIVGLILAMVTVFKPVWSMVTAPLYAGAEGLFLGALSALIEAQYPGIVVQAVGLTFGTLACMLIAYTSGLIKVTQKLRAGIVAATGAVLLVYLATFVLGFFGVGVPYIHGSGPIGIGFSLLVVGIAAFNLLLDFDLIDRGVRRGAPKYMEWYGGFALLVTLVWLYIEFLRLLSKLRSR